MTRAGLAVIAVAACGRVGFVAVERGDAPSAMHRVLYAATSAPDELDAFAIAPGDGSLAPLPATPVAAGTAMVSALAIDPLGAFVVVAGTGAPGLATFAVDATTGVPSLVATTDTTTYTAFHTGMFAVTIEPLGRFVYTGDAEDNDFALALDRSTGALSLVAFEHVNATATFAVADARGRFLVTPGEGTSCAIQVTAIDQATGQLGPPVQYAPPVCLTDALRATLDTTATHVYVAENGNCAVFGYPIDPITGAVAVTTPVAGSDQFDGFDCFYDVELHPSGQWLYGAMSGVVVLGIDPATGAIAPRGAAGANTAADTSIIRIVLDPGGAFAYGISTSDALIYGYAIDAATGALAPTPGSPYAAAGKVVDLAIGSALVQ